MRKSLTLAMAMALGITTSVYAANPFSDVPTGHWAYDYLMQLVEAGVVEGYPGGTYGGDRLITRYEMAQIIARAMAKGINVDKLAAEFADELEALGVRVNELEKKADAVKITGEVRYHYADYDIEQPYDASDGYLNGKSGNAHQLRSRIWVKGEVNDDWSYTGMIQNIQDFDNETGEEDVKFKRAYVEGKLGGANVIAGRYNAYLVNGNLYDEHADGIEVSYGKDVKLTGFYMKPTNQISAYDMHIYDEGDWYSYNLEYGKAWGAKVDANIGEVEVTAGYTVFKDGIENGYSQDGFEQPFDYQDDNKVWNVGVAFDIGKDLRLTADYLKSNIDSVYENGEVYADFGDDDGYVVSLNYKGAKASVPSSYGVYATYYDQARGTVIAHTMNGFHGYNGFKGYMLGVNYTFAKDIVGAIEWYDLESKGLGFELDESHPRRDMKTLWAQVVFTF